MYYQMHFQKKREGKGIRASGFALLARIPTVAPSVSTEGGLVLTVGSLPERM